MSMAIEMDGYGPPEVLVARERAAAPPPAGHVVVRMAVAGVNRADCFIRSGEWPQAGAWPYVPGLEVAGVIETMGPKVRRWCPGDRVITMMQKLGGIHGERPGGYQETVTVPATVLAKVPDGLDLELAGVLGLPAVTALQAIDALDVRRGMRVLVHAGSSAVGTMALQILAARGAHPIATGTREEKFDLMRRSGAAEVVSTRDDQWARRIGTVDRVFDLVGHATFAATISLLTPGGRLVFVGGTSGGDLALTGWDLMRPITLTGYSSETLDQAGLQRAVDALAAFVAARRLVAHQVTRFPLAQAADAHRALESGALAGRVVLVPPGGTRRPSGAPVPVPA